MQTVLFDFKLKETGYNSSQVWSKNIAYVYSSYTLYIQPVSSCKLNKKKLCTIHRILLYGIDQIREYKEQIFFLMFHKVLIRTLEMTENCFLPRWLWYVSHSLPPLKKFLVFPEQMLLI